MATEADIEETILLKEKCLNPGEPYQPPQTVVYLVKSGNVEVASNVEVEIVNSGFEGNAGVTVGESFSESPSIAKVPDQETNRKQETHQAKEISYQAEETMREEKEIGKGPSFKSTEVIETRKHEVVDEINEKAAVDDTGHQSSDAMVISSKMEKIEQPYPEVVKEETSKEEVIVNQVEADRPGLVEENQMNIGKETTAPQKDEENGRIEDNIAELKASNGAAMLEASTGLNEEPSILASDLTLHHLDTNVETCKQESLKNEHEDDAGYAETITIEENSTERISEGVQGEKTDGCSSVLDEENSPNVAKPTEKEKEKEDTLHDSIGEASLTLAASLEIQSYNQENSSFVEDAKDKLDSPSVTLATDRSSVQEETSNVASTEESQDATSNDKTNDIISTVDQTQEKNHVEISSDTETEELSLQEVDKTEKSKMVTETSPEGYVKEGPQETMNEAIGKNPEADSCGGGKDINEATAEGKLDILVKHEDGEKNIDEEMTILDVSALDNRDEDRGAAVAGEENISQAVTALQSNQEESGKEKNLSSMEPNQKIETAETDFDHKNSGETHLLEQETILVSKELGQDSNMEPQGQLHEATGDRYDEKQNENDSQACESTEKTANRVVTTEQSSETSENENKKLEELHKLGSQDQSEYKDGVMSIKEEKHEEEEACETKMHKSEITGDDNTKCHTDESGSETISSTDFLQETTEKNFQAGSLHEAATALKDEEVTKNRQITGIEKVTDEEVIQANGTNLSSEVINEETVESYQQIDKEADVSKGEDIEEQIIEGTSTACISLEAVEEAPVKNFESDENNIDNPSSREMLLEPETAETADSIGNNEKGRIPDLILQSSLVQEHEILQSENIMTIEGSSAEITMTNDKENHTNLLAETGEHKEILKGVDYLEQAMQKNEDKEHTEQPLNVLSAETETALSQSYTNTVQERVEHPQEDESEAETEKEESITNGSYVGSALQEFVHEDPVIFQKNESSIDKSSTEITRESTAAATCQNITSETTQTAECPIESIPTSLVDTTASHEFFETITCAKDDTTTENQEESSDKKYLQEASIDVDDIRDEIRKEENISSRELNEKIEITEGETLGKKVNEINETHPLEKELAEVTNFETQEKLHEGNGGDEVKNDETESQACKGTENTDSEHPSPKEAETTETSEAEIKKLEKVHEPESKEEIENKDAQMSIEENIGNEEESRKKDIQNLATSDDTEKYHTEEVYNHEKIEQNFQAEETSTTSEGEENNRRTISVIDKEITGVDEVTIKENIEENFSQLSREVTDKETAESSEQAEKEADKTTGENTEEKIIMQKSFEEEPINNFQSYEKKNDKPSSRQNFEESETVETVTSIADEAKQNDTSPNSTPQSSMVAGYGSLQSENQTICDGSPAKEIVVDGSSIKEAEDKDNYNELTEGGEYSKELQEEEGEEAEKTLLKNSIEQPPHVISPEPEAGALSQIDNIMVKETDQSPQENEERDAGREKEDIILLKGEEDVEEILQNDNTGLETKGEASSQTDNSTVEETTKSPQENEERDAGREKEDGTNESNSKCLQLETVVQNSAKDFENDDRVEESNMEIFEESEAEERAESTMHEKNQSDETLKATIPSLSVKEAQSLQFEDKGILKESSPEEKKDERSSISLLEEAIKEIGKHTSEPVHFSLEMNQNEESPHSSLQTSTEDAEQTLHEKPHEKMEHPLNNTEETVVRPQENEERDAGREKEDGTNESNSKCLQLESVVQNSAKDFENDDRVEESNTEIFEESEAEERAESTMHEKNQSDETLNATIPSLSVKEAQSLQFEDKGIPKESSPEEKKDERSSISLLEEDIKEIDKHTSEPVHFSLEMNQNEESLHLSLQTSTEDAEQTLQEKPHEKMEHPLNNTEETVVRPQDNEGDAEPAKPEDIVNECNNKSLPLEHVAHDDAAEKSDTEIPEQPKPVESVENITHDTDQNDSPNAITTTALVEDVESLHYEDKDIAVEASAEERKEEPSSVKTGDGDDSITLIEENNKEGGQETYKTGDYSSHEMKQNEKSLNSSTQASVVREEETPGSDDLTLAEASTKKDEDQENYTVLIEVGEHNKESLKKEEDAEEILQKVAQDPVKNFKNDGDGAENSNKEILKQPKAEGVENNTDETNQDDSPNATNLAAPVEDVESLQCDDKNIEIKASAEEKPSSVNTSEDSNGIITVIEQNNKEGDHKTPKTDDYSSHELTHNEESLNSSIEASMVREEEGALGSDNLTPVEASDKMDEDKESYPGLIEVEHNEEQLEKEEDAEQLLQKDAPKEHIKEPSNEISVETEAEALSEFKETVERPQDNAKRDAGREKEEAIDESNIGSLPLESVAQNTVKNFENDDHEENIGQSFQDNTKNTEIPDEQDGPKKHIIDVCDMKNISKEPVDQGTTKDLQNDEDNDEISNKEILEEFAKDKMGQSIALETNQNYEITNTTIPTTPVKEGESLLDESENVNLEEPLLEAKKEDDGSVAKASQDNGSNAELAEAIKPSEAERSHGRENIEPKLQNEPQEFLELSEDSITQESEVAILDKKADEEIQTVQNNEKTAEEEIKENEDSDGSKLNDVSASEDIKVTAETYYANEVVEEKLVTSGTDPETTKAYVSDYSEKLDGEYKSERKEEEMHEENVIEGGNTSCMNEEAEKHITVEEHLAPDISPQPGGEETNLILRNKEEIAQIETQKENELTNVVEDTTQQVLDEVIIAKDQCTESAIVIADDMTVMVPKTEMHEMIQAAAQNGNTREQIMQEGREIDDILEAPLGGIHAEGPPEKDKEDENDTIKPKQELHNEQYQIHEQGICKTEISRDDESSNVGDEALKCPESTNTDKKKAVLDEDIEESIVNKSEPSLKGRDAAENATDEHEAGNINQVDVTTETKSSGVAAEENLESAEPSMKLDHTSEIVPSDQSRQPIPEMSPDKFEENQISESVEQRSQGSPGSWQEMVEKTEPHLEIEDQINETRDIEDTEAAILIEEVHKEVEKAEGDENVEHFNKDGDDIKELHSESIEGEIIHEVKEIRTVSSGYLTTTDSNEQTEAGSLEVREAQDLEKESSATKENKETKEEVIKEQIIENTDSSSDKIKEAIILEAIPEPRLEEVQIDEKPFLVSDISSDASSPHAAETDAGQQESMALEENSSKLPSQLPTDDQENVMLMASGNAAAGDIEESREISDTYETKNHDVRELHIGEVTEGIKEAAETVLKSQAKETVTEDEIAVDRDPPEEITKESEVPSLALPCTEEDCRTESTIENIEKHAEKVDMKKDKPPENSSALKTVEDVSLQTENRQMLDVSQLDIQVKKGTPYSPTEEHREKGGTACDTKKESEEASVKVSKYTCHSLGETAINEVADDQTLHSEKSEEQYQTEPCVLLSKELELGNSTEIEKLEETMKGKELLEHDQRNSEEACLQKQESSELQVSEPDLEPKKDTEESSNEAPKEISVTSAEIGNKKEAFESKLDSNSKENEAAKEEEEEEEEEEEITPVQTNYMDQSQEENLMPSYPLLSKEQDSTIIGNIEEKTKKLQVLEDEPKAIQDACLQKEEPRELKVSSYEFQPPIDEQESLKEIQHKEDGATNGLKEETEGVSKLVLNSSSQDHTIVSEDKITSHEPQPTEKSEEENQTYLGGLQFEKQEHDISTISETIEGKTTREEVPENAPKTIEEASLKEEPQEFKPSDLELQMGDDIQNKVHDAKDGTAEESLNLQSEHEIEKRDAEKVDLVLVDRVEKASGATELVHAEATNEQILEEKSNAKRSHAIIGEDATKQSHQERQPVIEETLGAKILEKEIENEKLPEEIAKADQSETTTKQISAEKGPVEPFLQNETGETIVATGRELSNENQYDKTTTGDGSVDSMEKESSVEKSQKEGAAVEATEIIQNIHQQEKTSDVTLKDQIPGKIEPETMASSSKKEVPEVQQEQNVETEITEIRAAHTSAADSEVQRIVQGVELSMADENGKAIEETVSKDSATISLQDMLQKSRREYQAVKELSEEKEPTANKEDIKDEKQTEEAEKAKSDEEVVEEVEEEDDGEEEEDIKKNDSGSDAPVMVESSRDIEMKIVHKKSHNILSGVGSKVKHSIIKVKKAITCKSSHTKQHSAK